MPAAKKAAKKAPAKKRKVGRPRFEADKDQVERLAQIGATNAEIAVVLGCSQQTVENNFLGVIKRGREDMKMSIRRMQLLSARSGNSTMLIWLGKQHLGQTDKQQLEHSGPEGGPIDVNLVGEEVKKRFYGAKKSQKGQ